MGAALSPGDRFTDRYRVEGLLGRGGMGAVYRVTDLALEEPVALKVLTGAQDPAAVARFLREVKLARRVTHPNVARVFDLGGGQGQLFFTMELCAGDTLRTRMRRNALGWADARPLLVAMLRGLRAIHEAGIVHRDLKPGNVLFDATGRLVLADFGIARGDEPAGELTHGVVGTPVYMAPEQAAGLPVDARTDLFALARMAVEMLRGAREDLAPPAIQRELSARGVPPAVAAALARASAFDPRERPASADALLSVLEEAAGGPPASEEPTAQLGAILRSTRPEAPPGLPAVERDAQEGTAGASPVVVAVLPYRFRGPAEHAHLGAVLADDLVDALSRTDGLLVLASGATAAHAATRDPRAIGGDLGATLVVDGSVRLTDDRVVITSRVLEAKTGLLRFVTDFEGALSEVLALQETTALRVAESLRLPLVSQRTTRTVSTDAMSEYLAARGRLASREAASAEQAISGFERALTIAPDFAPAVAGHAVASVQGWFRGFGRDEAGVRSRVERSVARAMQLAPHLAESHLAAATCAMQEGRMPEGVRHLERALSIAPTYAEALETLGMLEIEIGAHDAARRHLGLARTIDPSRDYAAVAEVRLAVLGGSLADPWEHVRTTTDRLGPRKFIILGQRIRMAGWLRQLGALEECLAWAREDRHAELTAVCRGMLGQLAPAQEFFERTLSRTGNARTLALVGQLLTEALLVGGDPEGAEATLERAADAALIDREWLRRCPLLAPLRGRIPFDRALRKVEDRVASMQLSSRG